MANSSSSSLSNPIRSQTERTGEHSYVANDFRQRLAQLLSSAPTLALPIPSRPVHSANGEGSSGASLSSQHDTVDCDKELHPVTPSDSSADEKSVSAVILLPNSATGAGRRSMRSRGRTGGRINGLIVSERTFNNTGRPPLIKVPSNNAVFRITQCFELLAYHVSATASTSFVATNFTIGVLDQIVSLTNVFDQYRIDFIEAWITPRIDTVVPSAASNPGIFHTVIDFDDSSTLTTIGQALDYSNVMMASGVVGHYRAWKPHVAGVVQSGSQVSVHNLTSPWLDSANTSVQHYGLKTAWTVTDIVYTMDATFRIHCSFRNVR